MTALRLAAQQVLEALDEADTFHRNLPDQRARRLAAITALRAALAQQTLNATEECEHKADGWYAVQRVAGVTRVWPMTEAQALRAALAQQAEPVQEPFHPSRLALFARACQHPVALEIMADCADCVDAENSAQHDSDVAPYDGEKWLALAAELRQQAAEIRAEDPEIWPTLVYAPQPPAEPVHEEPVCDKDPRGCYSVRCQLGKMCKHATPPQRTMVPLTEDEIYHATGHCGVSRYTAINITRAVEQAHEIKE